MYTKKLSHALKVMGAPMAGHLLKAGHQVTVHTRTPAKAEALVAAGARRADSPAAAAAACDVCCVMVGYPSDVRAVASAVLPALRPGAFLVDFTTSSPALAAELFAEAASVGVSAVDAPVTGGDVGARNATLSILCGGAPDALAALDPLLRLLGTPHNMGGPGCGQRAKLANQARHACMHVPPPSFLPLKFAIYLFIVFVGCRL